MVSEVGYEPTALRLWMPQFGIPKELITDNGPEFSSQKFPSFSKTWDILHKKISLLVCDTVYS